MQHYRRWISCSICMPKICCCKSWAWLVTILQKHINIFGLQHHKHEGNSNDITPDRANQKGEWPSRWCMVIVFVWLFWWMMLVVVVPSGICESHLNLNDQYFSSVNQFSKKVLWEHFNSLNTTSPEEDKVMHCRGLQSVPCVPILSSKVVRITRPWPLCEPAQTGMGFSVHW